MRTVCKASWLGITLAAGAAVMTLFAGNAAAGEVTFYGEDFADEMTLFHNEPSSEDVVLVRYRDSNEFYILPPGETAIVHPTGIVEGSVPMVSFFANLAASETGVAYKVTDVTDVDRATASGGPYTPIAVGDVLTSCMYYRRSALYTSEMTVTDVGSGKTLKMPKMTTIAIIVPHHVPWDPRFENVNGVEDFADFGYASFSMVGDEAIVWDDSTFNPDGAQLGIHGSYGEAVVPQRMGGGPAGDGAGKAPDETAPVAKDASEEATTRPAPSVK